MLALFSEGVATSVFPCSLVLAVPSLAVAVASRRSSGLAAIAFLIGLLANSWLRFAGIVGVWPSIVTGTVVLVVAIAVVRRDIGPPGVVVLSSAWAGAAAASLWRPCVGVEFGQVLTDLNDAGLRGLIELAIYLSGVLTPIIAVIAALNAMPRRWLDRSDKALRFGGGAVLGILAVGILIGLHERVIDELFRLSSF